MMHVALGNGIGYEVEGDLKTVKVVRFVAVGASGRRDPTFTELSKVIGEEFPDVPKNKIVITAMSYSGRVCILYSPRK